MRRGVLATGCHLVEEPVLDDLAEHPIENLCGDLAGVGRRLTQLVVRLLLRALRKFVKNSMEASSVADPGCLYLYHIRIKNFSSLTQGQKGTGSRIRICKQLFKVFLTQKLANKLMENMIREVYCLLSILDLEIFFSYRHFSIFGHQMIKTLGLDPEQDPDGYSA